MDIKLKLPPEYAEALLDPIPTGRDNGLVEAHNRQQCIDQARAGLGVFVVAQFHMSTLQGSPLGAVVATRSVEAAEAVGRLMEGYRIHWRSI